MSSSSSSSSLSIFLPPDFVRLVTILAHVDHGKTTLADNLISYNNIISERLAGTLRYLDSDAEEQRRGITIRTSAIGLQHEYCTGGAGGGGGKQTTKQKHILHLLDSPGHADFGQEVTSSLLACDVAIIVIDVLEGMGTRTHQVLRESMVHALHPILVVNKIDKLFHLHMTPTEAFLKIQRLLETINAATAAMWATAQANAQQQQQQNQQTTIANNHDTPSSTTSKSQQQDTHDVTMGDTWQQAWTFDPAIGNVIFASAIDGWAFTVPQLCKALFRSGQVPIKPKRLASVFFGEYKLVVNNSESNNNKPDADDVKLFKWKPSNSDTSESMPIFAQYALEPLWQIYQGVSTAQAVVGGSTGTSNTNSNTSGPSSNSVKIAMSTPGMEQVLNNLQIGSTASLSSAIALTPQTAQEWQTQVLDRQGATNAEAVLRCLLRRYRPLSPCVLDVVCSLGPSPRQAAAITEPEKDFKSRQVLAMPRRQDVLSLQQPQRKDLSDEAWAAFEGLQQAVHDCNPTGPTVAYVCKFMSTSTAHVRDVELSSTDNGGTRQVLMGLARVLCGKLTTNDSYYLLGPKHGVSALSKVTSSEDDTQLLQRKVRLYLLMGSSFVLVDQVPAGHLCAIYGLENVPLKTMTLCDSPHGMPVCGFDTAKQRMVRPLVKVNVEAVSSNAQDTEALERGLVKLSLADASVEVTATAKGERLLACMGELHLEQSILDLRNVYGGTPEEPLKVRISDPIVDFGETTDWLEGELKSDYKTFYVESTSRSTPPLRQVSITPYNEEEGVSYAKHGRCRVLLTGRVGAIQLRVVPLVPIVRKALDKKKVVEGSQEELINIGKALNIIDKTRESSPSAESILSSLLECVCSLGPNGNALIESPLLQSGQSVRGVVSITGEVHIPPRFRSAGTKSTVVVDSSDSHTPNNDPLSAGPTGLDEYQSLQESLQNAAFDSSLPTSATKADSSPPADEAANRIWNHDMKGSAVAGFQLAERSGPICEEPIRNVLVILEGVEVAVKQTANDWQAAKPLSGGIVVSALRSGIRCALLTRPIRLMEGILRLTLHSSLSGIGSLYSVLSKRRGKVVEDTMVDGTDLLLITALVPQCEAFGLAPELFKKTSGEVTAPEMIFSHWARLDVDPFWIPESLEEREDFGEVMVAGDASTGIDNPALHNIRRVRQRKGLLVDHGRLVAAEKQRTLKK